MGWQERAWLMSKRLFLLSQLRLHVRPSYVSVTLNGRNDAVPPVGPLRSNRPPPSPLFSTAKTLFEKRTGQRRLQRGGARP